MFLDLLAIRTLLTCIRHPLAWFAGLAALSGGFSLLALVALLWTLPQAEVGGVVFMGLCVLFGALTLFLVFLGLLSVLIYNTGSLKAETFSGLLARGILPAGAANPTDAS